MAELDLYSGSLALPTDLYQLTMARGYWMAGHNTRAQRRIAAARGQR